MLELIFQDKDKWKEYAFDLLKNELLSVNGNRWVQFDKTNESHLVCVYGKSQVGKTTLILNMIGLKDEGCRKIVSNVLRGGVPRGNSSTSTAILYSQSDKNFFGIRIETLDGNNDSSEIEYHSSEKEMILHIQKIRDAVEKNEFPGNVVVHIFLPNDYFSKSIGKENISILDLPGVESRNIQEKAHVDSLMKRYIPISSVCVIVCPANVIQSLETTELPNMADWKNLAHRFVVVLTKSYSNGLIKSYFDEPRSKRKEEFCEFVQKRYNLELSRILGPNKVKVFPLDVGDSFERLLESISESDREELKQTRNRLLSSLRDYIISHKGERFLSAVKDLHAIVEQIDEEELSSLKSDKQCKIEKLKQRKQGLEAVSKEFNDTKDELEELESSANSYMQMKNKLDEINCDANLLAQRLVSEARENIIKNDLVKMKNGASFFFDKKRIFMRFVCDYLLENLKVDEKISSILKDVQIYSDFDTGLAESIWRKFSIRYDDKLYPRPSGLIERIFGNRKVPLSSVFCYINDLKEIIEDEVQTNVVEVCNKRIGELILKTEKSLCFFERKKRKAESRIDFISKSIEEIETKVKTIEEQEQIVQKQKMQDLQTLHAYLRYAETAYTCQRNEIIKKINLDITPEEKTLYLLFLGVLRKNYNDIIEAS